MTTATRTPSTLRYLIHRPTGTCLAMSHPSDPSGELWPLMDHPYWADACWCLADRRAMTVRAGTLAEALALAEQIRPEGFGRWTLDEAARAT